MHGQVPRRVTKVLQQKCLGTFLCGWRHGIEWKTSQDGIHKLATLWEGPYIIKAVTRPTSYSLARLDGTDVPNSVHIDKLRCFYP
jgi:hypothetical protein